MKILLLTSVLVCLSVQESPLVVNTPLGLIEGTEGVSRSGKRFNSFLGIPYAKAPVGDLRFRPPEPVEAWSSPLKATDGASDCSQTMISATTEDCLLLHIHTPKVTSEHLSVIVWIHGGGFCVGSPNRWFSGGPEFFMDEDIILVMISYRLNVLGFLSTGDREASGNYGLRDQIEALHWIQKNIASFGGNPNDVTIIGESAGSAAVQYLMLSPLAKGLFHKAFAMSGSVLNPWARSRTTPHNTKIVAQRLGCPTDTSHELVQCLRTKSASELMIASTRLNLDQFWEIFPFYWVPRVDSEAEDPVLPRDPISLLQSGDYNKVPLVMGHVRDEGLLYKDPPLGSTRLLQEVLSDWRKVCSIYFNFFEFEDLRKEDLDEICRKIHQKYLQNYDIQDTLREFAKVGGFGTFESGIFKSVELMHRFHPVFYYSFDFFSKTTTFFKVFTDQDVESEGVSHATDLVYLYNYTNLKYEEGSREHQMSENLVSLVTTFAKTGKPSFKHCDFNWEPTSAPDFKQVSLQLDPFTRATGGRDDIHFWENIYKNTWYKSDDSNKDEL